MITLSLCEVRRLGLLRYLSLGIFCGATCRQQDVQKGPNDSFAAQCLLLSVQILYKLSLPRLPRCDAMYSNSIEHPLYQNI